MKNEFICLTALLTLVGGTSTAQADLWNIGSATYSGEGHNLIYDTDQQLTFFDYTNDNAHWQPQMDWAGSLSLAVTLNAGYSASIDWLTGWRLPEVDDPERDLALGIYNDTNSELGRLYYDALNNTAGHDGNTYTPFEDLRDITQRTGSYWTGSIATQNANIVWDFSLYNGERAVAIINSNPEIPLGNLPGLAVHDGVVTYSDGGNPPDPIPEPATILLFGAGLAGLAGYRRRQSKKK